MAWALRLTHGRLMLLGTVVVVLINKHFLTVEIAQLSRLYCRLGICLRLHRRLLWRRLLGFLLLFQVVASSSLTEATGLRTHLLPILSRVRVISVVSCCQMSDVWLALRLSCIHLWAVRTCCCISSREVFKIERRDLFLHVTIFNACRTMSRGINRT